MYFPYLRGKQFELIALREYINANSVNNKVLPIIEPVKVNLAQLTKTLNIFEEKNQKIAIILNPQIGHLKTDINSINDTLNELLGNYNNTFAAIIVNAETNKTFVEDRLNLSNNVILIHYDAILDESIFQLIQESNKVIYNVFKNDSRRYRRKVSLANKNLLLEDHFPLEVKNANYPEDSFFSEDIYYYSDDGFCGFSDFSIIGDYYREEGGPAYAVAIHLFYEKNNEELRIRHFVSSENDSPTNPGGKFLDALNRLIAWISSNPENIFESSGVIELRRLHTEEHYPGLGYLKKISIIHHLELCNFILNR